MGWWRVWIGVVFPYPPVRNFIVTPSHMFSQLRQRADTETNSDIVSMDLILSSTLSGIGSIMMMIVKEDKKRSRAGTKSISNDVIIGSLTEDGLSEHERRKTEDGLSPTTTNQVSPSKVIST